MSLVAPSDLANYLREDASASGLQAAIDAAEAVVAAYLGAPSLAQRTVSEVHVMLPSRAKTLIELLEGPLTALSAVTVDGTALDLSKVRASYWAIAYPEGFGAGASVRIDYTAGWDAATLPAAVRQAVILVAASIYARPDAGVARLGSTDGYTAYRKSYVNPDVQRMLKPWRRPSWT